MGGRRLTRAIAVLVTIGVAIAVPHGGATADGRGRSARVLPPSAAPLGYTREDMTGLLALFTTSGNDPAYYPDTPFQILHTAPGGAQFAFETRDGEACEPPSPGCGLSFSDVGALANRFEVSSEQPFFVPVDNADDGSITVGPSEVEGVEVDELIGCCPTYLVNYTGHPAASIPQGPVQS